MREKVAMGIVGAGSIAGAIARVSPFAESLDIVAVASRRPQTAQQFAEKHGIPRCHENWQALLADNGVDAVYIATPTAVKEEIALAAVAAGKHILVDKPFASAASVQRLLDACDAAGKVFLDATHFTHHPRTAYLQQWMEDQIGPLLDLRSSFFAPVGDRNNIRFDPALEPTGAIGDLAWYNMRAIVEFMPERGELADIGGYVQRSDNGAVLRGGGFARFTCGQTSTFNFGFNSECLAMDLDLFGERGLIQCDDFVQDWRFGIGEGDPAHKVAYQLRRGIMFPSQFEHIAVESDRPHAAIMLDRFAGLISNHDRGAGAQLASKTLQTQALLDAFWDAVNRGL